MAEYEKKVRKILSQNGCMFAGTEKGIMIFGIARLQTVI